jgi:predicted hydrocarbon binding protein
MTLPEPSASDAPPPPASSGIAPELPLSILESVRRHDRPTELLEEEDLTASLPRRLGLTGVVETQIQRYHDAVRRRRPVPADDITHLLRLVLRRPDAAAILREAGSDVARRLIRRHPGRLLSRLPLPRSARMAAARRATQRVMRRLAGPATLKVEGSLSVELRDSVGALRGEGGTACVLYSAVIQEIVYQTTGQRLEVHETHCANWGDVSCVWTIDS